MRAAGIVGPCPPTHLVGLNLPAFRWIFEKEHEDNFVPQHLQKIGVLIVKEI